MKRTSGMLALALCALAALASACSGDKQNFLERMFDLEARSAKGAPPRTVEELKKAIDENWSALEKTLAANDKVAMYWRLLAVRYMDKGMYGDAYEASRKALGFYPDNSGLYYVAGVSAAYLAKTAAVELQQPAATREAWLRASEASYLESLKIDKRNLRSWYGLASLYSFELERYDDAVSAIESYLAINTKDVDALFLRARSLYGAGRLQDAADAYEQIIAVTKVEEKKALAAENRKTILDELYGP